jgi:capsular polysaccharide transport system permease protein
VQAFDAADAQAVMQAIVDEGTILVNRLSDQAQADSTRYAEQDLADSVEQLKAARAALTRFRNETQIVDPASAVASQMGLLSQLEGTLAQQLIDLDLLRQTVPDGDPRITQAESRVEVIEARMAAERAKLGLGSGPGAAAASTDAGPADPTPEGEEDGPESEGAAADGGAPGGEAFADLVGQYESLAVDQQFAEQAYTAARTAYESALAEGRRQSRYLAAHVQPTLAERAEYPGRVSTTLLALVFAFLAWSILTLAAYALRDRR